VARRSDHSRDEIHAMALAAARRIVEADGLHDLTARRVADAIGYSPGTLYNVFTGLDDLVLRLNGGTFDMLSECLDALPPNDLPEADLKALAAAYIGFIDGHPNLWSAIMEHSLPKEQTPPAWYQAKIDDLMERIETALAPLFDDVTAAAKKESARILWSSLHGICSLSRSGKLAVVTAASVPQMAENLIVTYLAGLRAGRLAAPGRPPYRETMRGINVTPERADHRRGSRNGRGRRGR